MDNPEALLTLGTQDTDKQNTKTQHSTVNHNDEQNGRHQQPGVNLGARENTKNISKIKYPPIFTFCGHFTHILKTLV